MLMLLHMCRQMVRNMVPVEGLCGASPDAEAEAEAAGRADCDSGVPGQDHKHEGGDGEAEGPSCRKRRRVMEENNSSTPGRQQMMMMLSDGIPPFDPLVHVLPESIDSHCHPAVLTELWSLMSLDGALRDQYMRLWKDLIWTHSSGINPRRIESIVGIAPPSIQRDAGPPPVDAEFERIRDALLAVQWRFVEESLAARAEAMQQQQQQRQSTLFAFFGPKKNKS
jgi:hypothetical protein